MCFIMIDIQKYSSCFSYMVVTIVATCLSSERIRSECLECLVHERQLYKEMESFY